MIFSCVDQRLWQNCFYLQIVILWYVDKLCISLFIVSTVVSFICCNILNILWYVYVMFTSQIFVLYYVYVTNKDFSKISWNTFFFLWFSKKKKH